MLCNKPTIRWQRNCHPSHEFIYHTGNIINNSPHNGTQFKRAKLSLVLNGATAWNFVTAPSFLHQIINRIIKVIIKVEIVGIRRLHDTMECI